MPLSVKGTSEGIQNIYESNILKPIFESSVKSAILITVIIIFIVYISVSTNSLLNVNIFKMGFYIFTVILVVSSINRAILRKKFEESINTKDIDNIAMNATRPPLYGGGIGVNILEDKTRVRYNYGDEDQDSLSLSELLTRQK